MYLVVVQNEVTQDKSCTGSNLNSTSTTVYSVLNRETCGQEREVVCKNSPLPAQLKMIQHTMRAREARPSST